MNVCNGSPETVLIGNQPVVDLPNLAGSVPLAMKTDPSLCRAFIILHKHIAVFLLAIQYEMNVIVHQAETNNLDRMFKSGSAETESYPVDSGDKFRSGAEKIIIFQTLGGVMIIVWLIHSFFLER